MMAEFNDGISDSQLVAAVEDAETDLEVDRMRETDETASDIELCEALDEYEQSAEDLAEGDYSFSLLLSLLLLVQS
jgi:hypothetical protein